ncbi:hypothetical protein V6N11_066140 [Hibiscus sabdariffa]|uniref:Response regulatory domain-containing protein n=2 Tax=Hibiscus sabdariffa TaxID=183260 RepID=A0ABR2AHJ9_9ROSI
MPIISLRAVWKPADGCCYRPFSFVLVGDDDPTCLMILKKMLRTCLYEEFDNLVVLMDGWLISDLFFSVTKCNRVETALFVLRENRNGFDIVINDVHMPDMDGFKLLKHIGLEMDLPVITNEGNWGGSKKRKDDEEETDERDDTSTLKKCKGHVVMDGDISTTIKNQLCRRLELAEEVPSIEPLDKQISNQDKGLSEIDSYTSYVTSIHANLSDEIIPRIGMEFDTE